MSLSCLTCEAAFSGEDQHRLHFKSDWHRYNLRRKQAEMMPISETQFIARKNRVQAMMKAQAEQEAEEASTVLSCSICSKYFSSKGMLEQHLLSKKHKLAVKKGGSKKTKKKQNYKARVAKQKKREESLSSPELSCSSNERKEPIMSPKKLPVQCKNVQFAVDNEKNETVRPEPPAPRALRPAECLFCSHESACGTHEGIFKHMHSEHNFLLPDHEYLKDLPGLKAYLGEKVGIGHMCLYCQRGFSSAKACQQHMIDSSHCKMLYDIDVDMDEYEEFYDFSSSWAGVAPGLDGALSEKRIEIESSGELRLEDGRLVGHRDYNRVYKQQVRTEDTRDQVLANLANTAERILGKEMGQALVQARLSDLPHSQRISGRSRNGKTTALMNLSPMQMQAVRKARIVAHKAVKLHQYRQHKYRAKVQWNQNKLNVLNIGSNNKLGLSWKK
eukprot:g1112.t1